MSAFSKKDQDRCIWALLKVLNGWSWDAASHSLRLAPVLHPEECRGPWICPTGYGTLAQTVADNVQHLVLTTTEGGLTLAELTVRSRLREVDAVTVSLGGETLATGFAQAGNQIVAKFSAPLQLGPGSQLDLRFSDAGKAPPVDPIH